MNFFNWVIYHSPSDYPGKWVVRRWGIGKSGPIPDPDPLCIADSLREARSVVPLGLVCLPRHEHDDPAIYETWM